MVSKQIIYSIAIPVGACAIAGVTMLMLYINTLTTTPTIITRGRTASYINTGSGDVGDPNDIMISLEGGKRRKTHRKKRR